MVLTLYELNMIVDLLIGSLSIRDNGNIFNYSMKQREALVNSLLKRMNETKLDVSFHQDIPERVLTVSKRMGSQT